MRNQFHSHTMNQMQRGNNGLIILPNTNNITVPNLHNYYYRLHANYTTQSSQFPKILRTIDYEKQNNYKFSMYFSNRNYVYPLQRPREHHLIKSIISFEYQRIQVGHIPNEIIGSRGMIIQIPTFDTNIHTILKMAKMIVQKYPQIPHFVGQKIILEFKLCQPVGENNLQSIYLDNYEYNQQIDKFQNLVRIINEQLDRNFYNARVLSLKKDQQELQLDHGFESIFVSVILDEDAQKFFH